MFYRLTRLSHLSPASEDESEEDKALKPAKKKAVTEKPLTSFFDKVPAAPAAKQPASRKASGSQAEKPKPKPKAAASKAPAKKAAKKTIVSDDEDDDDLPPPPPRRSEAPKRAARAVTKAYIDISSDGDDGGSGSDFEDFD